MASSAIYPQVIQNWFAQITSADASQVKALMPVVNPLKRTTTAGPAGSRIEALLVSSTDTAAQNLVLSLLFSYTTYQLTTISIPANSGNTNALPIIDLLRHAQFPGLAYDERGNRYFYLVAGVTLQVNTSATVTANKTISVWGQGGDY